MFSKQENVGVFSDVKENTEFYIQRNPETGEWIESLLFFKEKTNKGNATSLEFGYQTLDPNCPCKWYTEKEA